MALFGPLLLHLLLVKVSGVPILGEYLSSRPGYAESKQWLDDHGWEILAYQPPVEAAA